MKGNMGKADRWIRVIIGLGILALGLTFKSWWGLIGIIPLATAAFGFCGLYALLGINTDRAKATMTKPSV
jgi:hypothetical protein